MSEIEETIQVKKSGDVTTESKTPAKKKLATTIVITSGKGGVGKTTTIGKIAASLNASGKKVLIAAADRFDLLRHRGGGRQQARPGRWRHPPRRSRPALVGSSPRRRAGSRGQASGPGRLVRSRLHRQPAHVREPLPGRE